MRKITVESVQAFDAGRNMNKANMSIVKDDDGVTMYLHGNKIARKEYGVGTFIFDGGWQSNTTKERLNGLISEYVAPRAGIFQKNWVWYYVDECGTVSEFNSGMQIA